ncbi:DnaD domain-containing protein [Brevibacillus reuszeri]|uniref:DnaD domain-containing protein n=1 Tax=Brevibacillus reuszeri TaxID=54915 RepID=UPI00366BE38A
MHNSMGNNFLLDEAPLVILPSLAEKIGLNEAIVTQQLHYWLQKSTNNRDGRKWVYNTYKSWQEQFPFWSEVTVRRTLTGLENKGIIVTGNYNEMKADKTKWYTIDYEKLVGVISPSDQNDQSMRSERSDGCDQNDQSNTRYYADITTDIEGGRGGIPKGMISPPSEKIDPVAFFQENIGVIPPLVVEDMTQWMDGKHFDEPNEIIVEAIRETVTNGARSWKYTTKILIGWAERGLRTLQQVQAAMLEHEQSKGKGYRQGNKDNPFQSGFDKRAAADKAFLESMQSGQAFVEKDTGYDPSQDQELQKLMNQLHTK